jgi:hypothetical protein
MGMCIVSGMTDLTITTAAIRMRTALNARRRGKWRLYFDGDGREVCAIYGPDAYGPNSSEWAHHFTTRQEPDGSLHRWTSREVQAAMDSDAGVSL